MSHLCVKNILNAITEHCPPVSLSMKTIPLATFLHFLPLGHTRWLVRLFENTAMNHPFNRLPPPPSGTVHNSESNPFGIGLTSTVGTLISHLVRYHSFFRNEKSGHIC